MPRSPIAQYRPYHPDEADYPFDDIVRRGNGIRVTCWGETGCEHAVTLSGHDLLRFGDKTTIRDLFPRLSCSACGSKRVSAHVIGVGARPGQMSPD